MFSRKEKYRHYKILLIDDDQEFAVIATKMLRKIGPMVKHAFSAKEALHLLSEENFDLILSDYYMPNENGLSLLNKIRENKIQSLFIL